MRSLIRTLSLITLMALTACTRHSGEAPNLNAPERVAAGQIIYAQHCAACHGAKLEGQPDWTTRQANGRLPAPPHDDSGHTWHHDSALLFGIVKSGLVPPYAPPHYLSDMPAFGARLSDEDIWNVLAFIRSRWSPEVRARHEALDAAVRQQRADTSSPDISPGRPR